MLKSNGLLRVCERQTSIVEPRAIQIKRPDTGDQKIFGHRLLRMIQPLMVMIRERRTF